MKLLGWKLFCNQVSHLWLVLGKKLINHTEQGWHAASGSAASHGPGSCPPTLCPRVIHHSPELCSLLSRGQACCTQCQLSDPRCQVVTHALLEETRNRLSYQTSGSQTRVCIRMPQGLVKYRWLNTTPRISDSIGLGRVQESVFLVSSHMMQMLLVCGTTCTSVGLSLNLAICPWASFFS